MKRTTAIIAILLIPTFLFAQGRGTHRQGPEHIFPQVDSATLSIYKAEKAKSMLYRTAAFNMEADGAPALVIYIHGMSGRGSDNLTQMRQKGIYSIGHYIDSTGMKAYFIVPQCPISHSWAGDSETAPYVQNVAKLVKQCVKTYGIFI